MIKNFTVSPLQAWATTCPFGGGWEPGKDPASRGWRVRAIDHKTAILAQKGGKEAWLVQAMGALHLTLYEIPPGELERALKARAVLPEMQRTATTESTSGWALKFIGE